MSKGDIMAHVGKSGNAMNTDQPHVHFEIRGKDGTSKDPTGCLR